MSMSKCYIAGPISGKSHQEVLDSFGDAAMLARSLGWHVISPLEMDIDFDGEVNEAPTSKDKRKFARRDIHVIVNELSEENGDVVFVLPGWDKSMGAQAEAAVAKWVMLPVLPIETLLD